MMKLYPITRPLLVSATLCISMVGCGAGREEFVQQGEERETEPAELGSLSQGLFMEQAGACDGWSAPELTRVGGTTGSSSWRTDAAGEFAQSSRHFDRGQYRFTVLARGHRGSDGSLPRLRLTLNGFTIGSDVEVTQGITDGARSYTFEHNIRTGNSKQVRVELVNPGQDRELVIYGIGIHCPPVVDCDGTDVGVCCWNGEEYGTSCTDGGNLYCDENADCGSGKLCAYAGYAFDNFNVQCVDPVECENVPTGQLCGELCKTPTTAETACSNGATCSDIDSGFMVAPGYKACVDL